MDRKKIQDEEQAALKRIQKILETEKKQKIIKEVSASGNKTKALKTIQKFFRSKKNYTRQELDIMSIQEIERLLKYAPDGSIIAPIRNITSQRDRDIFNAWQRKNRR